MRQGCRGLLPMWRDALCLLSINVAAYGPVLVAMSINATVCECMELVAVLGSALLRKVCRRCRLVDIGRWVVIFYAARRRGSYSALIWQGKERSGLASAG